MKAISILVLTCAVAVAASTAEAKKTGYPNGKGWQAVKSDFGAVKDKVDAVQATADEINDGVAGIQETLAEPLEVTIANEPVLVQNIDQPATQAVIEGIFLTFPNGLAFTEDEVLFSVPAGKRLVIEFISSRINTAGADDKRMIITLSMGAVFNSATFVTPPPVPSSIGTNSHILSQSVKLYSDPGADIKVRASRGPDVNGTDSIGVRIWGHLVDVDE